MLLNAQDADLAAAAPMQDGNIDGLISQNAYLKEALDICRSDIASMSQQVGTRIILPMMARCVLSCPWLSPKVAALKSS